MDKSLIRNALNKKAKDAGAHQPGESSALLAAAQLVIGVFGAAILLVYPTGFLTLQVQIMLEYEYSAPEALYATSMIPTSVVAGGALFLLVVAPFAAFPMFYIALLYAWLVEKLRAAREGKTKPLLWRVVYMVVTIAVVFIPLAIIYYYGIVRSPRPNLGAWILLVVVFSLSMGASVSGILSQRVTEVQSSGRYLRYIVPAIPFVVGAVVAGVCLNILISELGLPTIELQKKHSDDSVTGTLLTHSDGSWYLINTSSDTKPLVAIPNERGLKVTIAEQPTLDRLK